MQILERFDKVRPAGRDTWSCCCPAHDDSSPSLTVTQEAGKWLFHCHAGCSTYDILEAVGLKWGDLFPDTNYKSDTADYARQLWGEASSGCVQFHPYAKKKQITHDFGARRGRASGRIIGRDKDCIIIPMRSWDGDLVGVECINWDGDKQTFGSKGQLILGHPEGATYVHITEGWATMWAIAQLRPKSFGGVVVFGKSRLEGERGRELDDEISNRFNAEAIRHREPGKADAWDFWAQGKGEQYLGGRFL